MFKYFSIGSQINRCLKRLNTIRERATDLIAAHHSVIDTYEDLIVSEEASIQTLSRDLDRIDTLLEPRE